MRHYMSSFRDYRNCIPYNKRFSQHGITMYCADHLHVLAGHHTGGDATSSLHLGEKGPQLVHSPAVA